MLYDDDDDDDDIIFTEIKFLTPFERQFRWSVIYRQLIQIVRVYFYRNVNTNKATCIFSELSCNPLRNVICRYCPLMVYTASLHKYNSMMRIVLISRGYWKCDTLRNAVSEFCDDFKKMLVFPDTHQISGHLAWLFTHQIYSFCHQHKHVYISRSRKTTCHIISAWIWFSAQYPWK